MKTSYLQDPEGGGGVRVAVCEVEVAEEVVEVVEDVTVEVLEVVTVALLEVVVLEVVDV